MFLFVGLLKHFIHACFSAFKLFTSTIVIIFAVFIYAWLSLWLRGKGWSDFGLKKPQSWRRTVLLALSVGIIFQALSLYVIEPFLGKLTGDIPDVSVFKPLVGNVPQLFFFLGLQKYNTDRGKGGYENESQGKI